MNIVPGSVWEWKHTTSIFVVCISKNVWIITYKKNQNLLNMMIIQEKIDHPDYEVEMKILSDNANWILASLMHDPSWNKIV